MNDNDYTWLQIRLADVPDALPLIYRCGLSLAQPVDIASATLDASLAMVGRNYHITGDTTGDTTGDITLGDIMLWHSAQ